MFPVACGALVVTNARYHVNRNLTGCTGIRFSFETPGASGANVRAMQKCTGQPTPSNVHDKTKCLELFIIGFTVAIHSNAMFLS